MARRRSKPKSVPTKRGRVLRRRWSSDRGKTRYAVIVMAGVLVPAIFFGISSYLGHLSSSPLLSEKVLLHAANTPVAEAHTQERSNWTAAEQESWKYFHPAWQSSPVLIRRAQSASLDLHDLQHGGLVSPWLYDPDNRISDDFQVQVGLRERVLFWMRIHSRFGNDMRVIHDRRDLSIVYGYSDFSSIYETSDNKVQAFYTALRHEKNILKRLRVSLAEASGLTSTKQLSAWERAELRALISRAGALSQDASRELIGNIRSQTGQRDEFLAALSRSENLLPYIESVFRRMSLPVELARIPFVESSFNPAAHSKVGAMGVWQFMPQTAHQMIGPNPSDWKDPLNQTWAAARLFRIFRTMLPDWSTAVTSYNSGAGRLKRLSTQYRASSIVPLLDVYGANSLGFAGKNFYAQFLSANIIEAYKYEIFHELKPEHHELLTFSPIQSFTKTFR